jgi:hypothetical protein
MSRNRAKKVTAQVLGGESQVLDCCSTVQDAFDDLELEGQYTATINGEPVDFDQELNDYEFLCFSPAVKGGM